MRGMITLSFLVSMAVTSTAEGQWLYWVERTTPNIKGQILRRASLNDLSLETVFVPVDPVDNPNEWQGFPTSGNLAFDTIAGKMYYLATPDGATFVAKNTHFSLRLELGVGSMSVIRTGV